MLLLNLLLLYILLLISFHFHNLKKKERKEDWEKSFNGLRQRDIQPIIDNTVIKL